MPCLVEMYRGPDSLRDPAVLQKHHESQKHMGKRPPMHLPAAPSTHTKHRTTAPSPFIVSDGMIYQSRSFFRRRQRLKRFSMTGAVSCCELRLFVHADNVGAAAAGAEVRGVVHGWGITRALT